MWDQIVGSQSQSQSQSQSRSQSQESGEVSARASQDTLVTDLAEPLSHVQSPNKDDATSENPGFGLPQAPFDAPEAESGGLKRAKSLVQGKLSFASRPAACASCFTFPLHLSLVLLLITKSMSPGLIEQTKSQHCQFRKTSTKTGEAGKAVVSRECS